jgi:hypothetical protein
MRQAPGEKRSHRRTRRAGRAAGVGRDDVDRDPRDTGGDDERPADADEAEPSTWRDGGVGGRHTDGRLASVGVEQVDDVTGVVLHHDRSVNRRPRRDRVACEGDPVRHAGNGGHQSAADTCGPVSGAGDATQGALTVDNGGRCRRGRRAGRLPACGQDGGDGGGGEECRRGWPPSAPIGSCSLRRSERRSSSPHSSPSPRVWPRYSPTCQGPEGIWVRSFP